MTPISKEKKNLFWYRRLWKSYPIVSCIGEIGTTPARLVRTIIGLMPTAELELEGKIIEPSVSGESIWCFRNSPQHLVGVSKTNKKLTSVLKKRNISILNHLNEKDGIDPKKFKDLPSLVFPHLTKSKCSSLSLSLSLPPFLSTTTAHQHLHDSIFSLSTPNQKPLYFSSFQNQILMSLSPVHTPP